MEATEAMAAIVFILVTIYHIKKSGEKFMSLVISDEIIQASGLTENELLLELILLLFQQDKLSLGKAAELLNISQIRFQHLLSERGLCIHYDVAEFRQDIQHLKEKALL